MNRTQNDLRAESGKSRVSFFCAKQWAVETRSRSNPRSFERYLAQRRNLALPSCCELMSCADKIIDKDDRTLSSAKNGSQCILRAHNSFLRNLKKLASFPGIGKATICWIRRLSCRISDNDRVHELAPLFPGKGDRHARVRNFHTESLKCCNKH